MDPSDVVLSVPAGDTHTLVDRYLVHAYPARYAYVQPYRYVTVREPRGKMRAIYAITDELTLAPPYDVPDGLLSAEKRSRLEEYRDRRRGLRLGFGDEDEQYTFFLLEQARRLPHVPRTAKPVYGHTYYSLAELTAGTPTVGAR